ncbi:MAG: putative secreted protein [Francisellaceae bacterium]|nr:putative secreted protein [Francisellaceae bacterium]
MNSQKTNKWYGKLSILSVLGLLVYGCLNLKNVDALDTPTTPDATAINSAIADEMKQANQDYINALTVDSSKFVADGEGTKPGYTVPKLGSGNSNSGSAAASSTSSSTTTVTTPVTPSASTNTNSAVSNSSDAGSAASASAFSALSDALSGLTTTLKGFQNGLINYLASVFNAYISEDAKLRFPVDTANLKALTNANLLAPQFAVSSSSNGSIALTNKEVNLNTNQNNLLSWSLYQQENIANPNVSLNSTVTNTPQEIIGTHFLNYCNSNSTESMVNCNNTDSTSQYGDLKALSLLGGTQYSAAQKTAANYFIRNLTAPAPTSDFGDKLLKLSSGFAQGLQAMAPSEVNKMASELGYNAAASVAQNSLYSIFADRDQTSSSTPSILSVMESEATRRFMDTAATTDPTQSWYLMVAKSTEQGLLKEIAQMEAFKIWLEYQRYRQMERIETLLAAQLSLSITSQRKADAAANPVNPNAPKYAPSATNN